MKTVKNIQDIIDIINSDSNYYYYRNQQFDNFDELRDAAASQLKEYFQENFEEDNICENINNKIIFAEDGTRYTIFLVESYIDSGVPEEDYHYGFIIQNN